MANSATSYQGLAASVTQRKLEVPDADFDGGCNLAASNSPGLGIATDNPGLDESLPEWTLLDQDGDARNPQAGQALGGEGLTTVADLPTSGGLEGKGTEAIDLVTPSDEGDGTVTIDGTAALVDLAVGWAAGV